MTLSQIAEIDADDFFEDDDSVDWRWCVEHATFKHQEECEFIIHIGDTKDDITLFENTIESMRAFGCTQDFLHCYRAAMEAGAIRVLFYA